MLLTSHLTLFDCISTGVAGAAINLCDCFSNVSCQNNIQFRVRYPGAYAADQITTKGSADKMGTVSFDATTGTLIFNAYIYYCFTDQRSIINGPVLDPMVLISCMYQIKDVLANYTVNDVAISISSFDRFNIGPSNIYELLNYLASIVPYNLIVTV